MGFENSQVRATPEYLELGRSQLNANFPMILIQNFSNQNSDVMETRSKFPHESPMIVLKVPQLNKTEAPASAVTLQLPCLHSQPTCSIATDSEIY